MAHNGGVTVPRHVVWLLCALATFALFALAIHIRTVEAFDTRLLRDLHHEMGWRLSRTMLFVNRFGSPWVVFPLTCLLTLWLAAKRDWRAAAFVVACMGGIAVLNLALRASFHRLRPDLWPSLLPNHSYVYSFPSGHACIIAGLALTASRVIPLPRRWNIVLAGIVSAVGFTTLGLGVHFLTDVLAGWALAVSWTLLSGVLLGYGLTKP